MTQLATTSSHSDIFPYEMTSSSNSSPSNERASEINTIKQPLPLPTMHFEQGGSGSGCLFLCLEFQYALRERVLSRVGEGCGMVVVDVLDAEEAEYFEDLLAEVTEGDGAVVR